MTFLPLAVTLAVLSTMNATSPLGVVTVSVWLAASNLLTVPVAVIIVTFAALAGLASTALAAGLGAGAGAAWPANAGAERVSTAAAIERLRNIPMRILLFL